MDSSQYFENIREQLKEGTSDILVLLRDLDPIIIQSTRYATSENFVGRALPGYAVNEQLMTRPAGEALKMVNQELKDRGY
jgi:zinc D-Ala-D-Ala dipeptidase